MRPNKQIVREFLNRDPSTVAALVADDMEWVEWGDGVPPSGVVHRGTAGISENIGDDTLRNEITRMTEEGDVVVAEGICHVTKTDGRSLKVRFCNIFELKNGRVRRQDSFGALLQDPA